MRVVLMMMMMMMMMMVVVVVGGDGVEGQLNEDATVVADDDGDDGDDGDGDGDGDESGKVDSVVEASDLVDPVSYRCRIIENGINALIPSSS